MDKITVIGAGLAGCEAAMSAARLGAEVDLIDMKPGNRTPAHKSDLFAELVCSNSLKAKRIDSAAGLLKEEMRRLNSVCLAGADTCAVAAGGALAVDRDMFSASVTQRVKDCEKINIISKTVSEIPQSGIVVIATGPLTAAELSKDIERVCGAENLSFFDAAAPIVTAESVDMSIAFSASRYDDGAGDYINCPMNKPQYEAFYEALISAETAPVHGVDKELSVYEGCMPIEVLARRGGDAVRFGPMKPVGLRDPKTGHRPWAAVQLRRENAAGTMYNLVGFQTNLKFGEQERVFSMIPGLKNAQFVRYGVMHRNSFINSPALLNKNLSLKSDGRVFFAGQLSGVEGYMESAASGIVAGINAARLAKGEAPLILPDYTMIGALLGFITDESVKNFQPMGANFGVLPPLEVSIRDKRERYAALSARALSYYDKRGDICEGCC